MNNLEYTRSLAKLRCPDCGKPLIYTKELAGYTNVYVCETRLKNPLAGCKYYFFQALIREMNQYVNKIENLLEQNHLPIEKLMQGSIF